VKDISMTLSSPDVTLVDGKGKLTASVTNKAPTAERIVLGAFPGGEPLPQAGPAVAGQDGPHADGPAAANTSTTTWTTIEQPLRTIAPGATAQYEVSFDTTGAAPGSYPVKLIPYSADEAPEDYAALGLVVHLAVPEEKKEDEKKEEKRAFPWWIVAAAEAVLLVAVGVWAFLATREPDVALSSFSPASGPVSGGTEVRLLGRFEEPTIVSLGDTRVEATRVGDEEYLFETPDAGQRTGQTPLTVESGGRPLGVIVFDYRPVLEAPASPPQLSPPAISLGGYARIEWPEYSCPSSFPPEYEVIVEPASSARIGGENPTRFTGAEIFPDTTGSITVTYRVQCGPEQSPPSPPGFLFVYVIG
jgi:hypothetical protein